MFNKETCGRETNVLKKLKTVKFHPLVIFFCYDRGWGIRCSDDIPKGAFVCVYSGHIWDEEEANVRGQQGRDQYFAELDHIGEYYTQKFFFFF